MHEKWKITKITAEAISIFKNYNVKARKVKLKLFLHRSSFCSNAIFSFDNKCLSGTCRRLVYNINHFLRRMNF